MSKPSETDSEFTEFEPEVPEILKWVLPCQGCAPCAPLLRADDAHPRRARSRTAARGRRLGRGLRRVAR